jgi:hypothetical protein
MPAVSKAQRKLMGMAYALKKGEISPKEVSKEVRKIAETMTLKELKKFASTDEKELPARKRK